MPRPGFRPQQQQQQQQQPYQQQPYQQQPHNLSRPGTPGQAPGGPGQPGQPAMGFRPQNPNGMPQQGQNPARPQFNAMPRPPHPQDNGHPAGQPNNAMRRPSAGGASLPLSPAFQRPPAPAGSGSYNQQQQQQQPGGHQNGAPLQRPPQIGGIQRAASPMIRPANLSQPGTPGMSPQIQARPPPGRFMGAPGSPAMNPLGYNASANGSATGFGSNQSQPPTPKMQHAPPAQFQQQQQQQQHQQQQQPYQQQQTQQTHQLQQSQQGPGLINPMAGPPPMPTAAGKSRRMYPQGMGSFQDPVQTQENSFQPGPVNGMPPAHMGQMPQPLDQGPQFFVPGEKPSPNFGQAVPSYQQGLQPLAGQPIQPSVGQLANQMGAMNVGNNSGYGFSNPSQGVNVRNCSLDLKHNSDLADPH